MMAYTLETGQTVPLLSYALPSSQVGTGGYSWNSEMTRGITSDGRGRGLAEQLYWFTPDHWEPLDVGLPQAYGAAWSPNDEWIAYLGAPEQGLSGVARTDAIFNLYLMKPNEVEGHILVQGFRDASSVAWSPDSRWLAFPATFGTFTKQEGMWLVDTTSGKRQLIAKGNLRGPAWSPDGRYLAMLARSGEYTNEKSNLVIVDVSELLH